MTSYVGEATLIEMLIYIQIPETPLDAGTSICQVHSHEIMRHYVEFNLLDP